jgi:peptidoglycan/xylan/chitin deacetylase (PgdA/CDA1 family)
MAVDFTVGLGRLVRALMGLLRLVTRPDPAIPPWSAASPILSGSPAGAAVALTFDDGPHPVCTLQVLTWLKRYGARATFFVRGQEAARYPELVQALVRAGHEVGNHSFSHPRAGLIDQDQITLERELESTAALLAHLGCPPTPLFRPPQGYYDDQLLAYITQTQRRLVLWTVDSGDWRGWGARRIAAQVLSRVRPGDIVLLHDGVGDQRPVDCRPTVGALKIILPLLRAAGYRLLTVTELLNLP